MTKGRSKILILIIASAIFAIFVLFSVAVTLAATDNWLNVIVPYSGASSTDTLSAGVSTSDQTQVTVTYAASAGDCHYETYDLIVYSSSEITPTAAGVASESFAGGAVVRNLPISTTALSFSSSIIAAYAYPATAKAGETTISYNNTFVSDSYSLAVALPERLTNPTDPIAVDGAFKNIFALGDITINSALTVAAPASIHLMHSTVTLGADLQLRHEYGGIYGIDAAGAVGSLPSGGIVQAGGTLSVTTPNAYFGIAEGIVVADSGEAVTPAVTCSSSSLTASEAQTLISSLLTAASGHITAAIPPRLTHNLTLPTAFASSGVKYSYSIADDSALSADGVLTRAEQTVDASLTVTMTYSGIYSSLAEGGTLVSTVTLDRSVVGTGDAAAAGELTAMISEYFSVGAMQAVGGKYAPTGDIDLTELLARFATLGFNAATLTLSEASGTTLSGNVITFSPRIASGSLLTLTAEVGEEQSSISFTLAGMTTAAVAEYLETLIYTPEFASVGARYEYVTLSDGTLYRGGTEVSPSLGVTAVAVKAVEMTEGQLETLTTSSDPSAYIAEHWDEWTAVAGLTDDNAGSLTVRNLTAGMNYIVLQKFTIDPDLSEASTPSVDYYSYRTAVMPDAGIGGSDTTQYIAGDTFANFYATLDNGRLLESMAYEFAVSSSGVGILPVLEGEDVHEYCYFVYKDGDNYVRVDATSEAGLNAAIASGKFYIFVDVSKFPARNASVRAHIYFFYATDTQTPNFVQYALGGFDDTSEYASSCFTTQTYAFMLPGIYRAGSGEAFASAEVYNAIINAVDGSGEYIYDAYRKNAVGGIYEYASSNYLYVDGAAATNASLTLSSITTAVDITGVQLLTGTSELIFDGVPISGMAGAFASANTHITSISMRSCGLTAAILGSHLQSCRALTQVDLSDNDLSTADLGALLYRTVRTLKLTNSNLSSVVGISALPNLETLDLSDNAIKYFGELIDLPSLRSVTVTGNTVSGSLTHNGNALYGTLGEVNVPVYVYLLNVREATIINGDSNITVGGGITVEQQLASLILTGVEYDQTVTSTAFSKSVTWGGSQYTVSSVMTVGSDFAQATPSSGNNFYFVVTVTYNSTTCYALYAATFGGGA